MVLAYGPKLSGSHKDYNEVTRISLSRFHTDAREQQRLDTCYCIEQAKFWKSIDSFRKRFGCR